MTPSCASFQRVGVVSSLTKSGRIPSHTTTTTCRSDLRVSAVSSTELSEKTAMSINIHVQYFGDMLVRRLRRRCGEPKPNPFIGLDKVRSIRAGLTFNASPLTTSSIFFFMSLASALASQLVPTTPGTTWRYTMTEEVGNGLTVPNFKRDTDGKARLSVLYRLEGVEDVDGRELFKFEMHRAGTITNTDLVTVDEHGINCWARINLDGQLIKFNPPQTMVAAPLKQGATWNFDGEAGDLKVRQRYDVTGEEDIEVPAGEFHAFHIRAEQSLPSRMTIDRWFAPGTGIVKDVTTMRATDGGLLERISLELAERPKLENRPEVKSDAASKRLSVSFAKDPFGQA